LHVIESNEAEHEIRLQSTSRSMEGSLDVAFLVLCVNSACAAPQRGTTVFDCSDSTGSRRCFLHGLILDIVNNHDGVDIGGSVLITRKICPSTLI